MKNNIKKYIYILSFINCTSLRKLFDVPLRYIHTMERRNRKFARQK